MPIVSLYEWSAVALPTDLTATNVSYDMDANHPNAQYYDPAQPTWTNQTYTFLGGAPAHIHITDDDPFFEDGYTETGAPQVLNQDVTLNGTTYAAGSVVEAEFSLLDDFGTEVWVVRIAGENVGFSLPASLTEIPVGTTFYPTQSRDGDPAGSSDNTSSQELYSNVACFGAATRLDTPRGPVRIADLRPGDTVTTRDSGAQPVIWISQTVIRFRGRDDGRRPVQLSAGCLGPGQPARDLDLSPQHRVLISGPELERRFSLPSALVPACGLLPLPGIRLRRGLAGITYVHLLLPRHAILVANGLCSESLFPGPMALSALSPGARKSMHVAAHAQGLSLAGYGPSARPTLTRREAGQWAKDIRAAAVLLQPH